MSQASCVTVFVYIILARVFELKFGLVILIIVLKLLKIAVIA